MHSTDKNPATAVPSEGASVSQHGLLRRFTKLAPAEWRVKLAKGEDGERFLWLSIPRFGYTPIEVQSDLHSAEAIVFLWDYLCGTPGMDECDVEIRTGDNQGWYCAFTFDGVPGVDYWGATRIEAVLRACISYWESLSDGQNGSTSTTTSSSAERSAKPQKPKEEIQESQ